MSQSMGDGFHFECIRKPEKGLKRHLKEFFHYWVENNLKRSTMEVKRQLDSRFDCTNRGWMECVGGQRQWEQWRVVQPWIRFDDQVDVIS